MLSFGLKRNAWEIVFIIQRWQLLVFFIVIAKHQRLIDKNKKCLQIKALYISNVQITIRTGIFGMPLTYDEIISVIIII